jgi:hypothetical protein
MQKESTHFLTLKYFDWIFKTFLQNELSYWIQLRTAIRLIPSIRIFQSLAKWDVCGYRARKMHVAEILSIGVNPVTSGVPQGSHLGPLLFIWFVNRISEIFDYVRVLFYADDMKIFLLISGSRTVWEFSQIWTSCRSGATETHCSSMLVSVRP